MKFQVNDHCYLRGQGKNIYKITKIHSGSKRASVMLVYGEGERRINFDTDIRNLLTDVKFGI